jgi:hypothetical protein
VKVLGVTLKSKSGKGIEENHARSFGKDQLDHWETSAYRRCVLLGRHNACLIVTLGFAGLGDDQAALASRSISASTSRSRMPMRRGDNWIFRSPPSLEHRRSKFLSEIRSFAAASLFVRILLLWSMIHPCQYRRALRLVADGGSETEFES